MDLKYQDATDITERRAAKLLNNSGFKAKINNLKNKTYIDLLVDNNLIDVQFSFNFDKYGDIRFDLLSAFQWNSGSDNKQFLYDLKCGTPLKFASENHIKENKKYGKYFDKNNEMEGVIYFLYNGAMPKNKEEFIKKPIASIVYIPKALIEKEILNNIKGHAKRIKINDKETNALKESFNSAFIPISVKYLAQKYDLPMANNKEEFLNKVSPYIKNSLSPDNKRKNNNKNLKNNKM